MSDVVLDELVVFSDHHAHPFTYGAKDVQFEGIALNSRVLASYMVLAEITQYAKQHNIDKAVFCGDLFHVREAVPTDAMLLTRKGLAAMAEQCDVYALSGNHDYFDRRGDIHSLYTLQDIVHVLAPNTDSMVTLRGKRGDDYLAHFVPYTDDRTEATRLLAEAADKVDGRPALLFAHLGMQGAKVGSDYVLVSDGDITVDDVPYDKFLGCFFGHYHQHQQLFSNGWYVGATHQHNWGDANTQRGFLHVKVYEDHVDFQFIETQSAPRFVSFDEAEPLPVRAQDFVKIRTKRKLDGDQAVELRNRLGLTANTCDVVYTGAVDNTPTLTLSEEMLSPAGMLQAWVETNNSWIEENEVDASDLLDYGRELLAQSRRD